METFVGLRGWTDVATFYLAAVQDGGMMRGGRGRSCPPLNPIRLSLPALRVRGRAQP